MKDVVIRYLTSFKFLRVLLLTVLILTMFVYGGYSTLTTFIIILLIGSIIISLIKSSVLVTYIALFVFWLKSILIYILYIKTNIYVFPDSSNYIKILKDIVELNKFDFSSVVSTSGTLHVGFYYIYIFFYKVFENDFAILMINTLLVVISSILFYEIIKKRFQHKVAFITFIIFNLSANIFLFGSFILKDPIVIFLVALSLYLYINKEHVFLALMVSLFLVTVRIYAGFSIIFAIIIDYLIIKKLSKTKKLITSFIILAFSLVAANNSITQNYISLIIRSLSDVSLFSILKTLPLTLFKFFFAPLPWNIFNESSIYRFLFLDSVILILFSFTILLFISKWIRDKSLRHKYYIFLVPILIHALTLAVAYGGGSTRQRSGIFIFLILTMVMGMFYEPKKEDD